MGQHYFNGLLTPRSLAVSDTGKLTGSAGIRLLRNNSETSLLCLYTYSVSGADVATNMESSLFHASDYIVDICISAKEMRIYYFSLYRATDKFSPYLAT